MHVLYIDQSCGSGPPKKHVEASRRYRKKMKEQKKELVSKKDALVLRNAELEEVSLISCSQSKLGEISFTHCN